MTALPRRPSVVATVASSDLAPLELDELRAYRCLMGAEDDLVHYWTALTRERISGLEGASGNEPLGRSRLTEILGDTGSGLRRRAISAQSGSGQLPPLPDLECMWPHHIDHDDAVGIATALELLRPSQQLLAAYSDALHALVDDSTRELILRYRADPLAAVKVAFGA